MTAVRFSLDREIGRLPFTYQNIESVPRDPGIYTFWFKQRCLYVGRSKDLHGRLTQHWRGSHNRTLRLWIDGYRPDLLFDYRLTPQIRLPAVEESLIQRLHPEANIHLVH